MKLFRDLIVVFLIISIFSAGQIFAQGNTFTKIRYQGGSIASNVKADDWNNTLTVTSSNITFVLKDGVKTVIDPKQVTGLSYGQEAHRKVGTMITLAVLVAPVALFGLLHKTRKHYIGMEWETADGKKEGILMQADKDNYRGVLMALRGVTGAAVSVSDEERKYIPVGIETLTVKQGEEAKSKK